MGLMRTSRKRGVVAVEAALVLPLLLLLTFGLMEYGWMFLKQQEITNAVRQGVRQAVMPDANAGDVEASVQTLLAQTGLGGSGYTFVLEPADFSSLDPGGMISGTIQVNYKSNIDLLNLPFLPTPASLQARVSMTKEGP